MIKYKEILNAYFFHILVYIYFGYLLVYPTKIMHSVSICLFVVTISYWLGHRFVHQLPTDGIWKYLNLHPSMHHYKNIKVSKTVELILEFLYEVFIVIFVGSISSYIGNEWLIPFSLIVYGAIFFALNHVIYYSILHSHIHEKHHHNTEINFIPDYFDHLFGKNADLEYEDMNQQIPLLLIAALATHLLKLYFGWTD